MLGKTAGGVYWLFRYMERSENTARLVDAGQRIALTRSSDAESEWESVLTTAMVRDAYLQKHETFTQDAAVDFLLRDLDNPSSVRSAIQAARDNAKTVRTALTREVWEAVNECWMVLQPLLERKVPLRELPEVLNTIRQRSAFVRGALHGTMMRNEIYNFARIGTFIERADNTGRILDVKYYVLLPHAISVGTSLDNVQWETILRSVSAEGAYRWAYGQDVRPRQIADFLIFDGRMPRSLLFCTRKIAENLGYLCMDAPGGTEALDMAEDLKATLKGTDIDRVIEAGLHEFIQDFIEKIGAFGRQIEVQYRFYG